MFNHTDDTIAHDSIRRVIIFATATRSLTPTVKTGYWNRVHFQQVHESFYAPRKYVVITGRSNDDDPWDFPTIK